MTLSFGAIVFICWCGIDGAVFSVAVFSVEYLYVVSPSVCDRCSLVLVINASICHYQYRVWLVV